MPIDILLMDVGTYEPSTKPGFNEFMYNLGLGYIAKAVMSKGHTFKIHQQYTESEEKLLNIIAEKKPRYLGMSSWTFNYPKTQSFVRKAKEFFPSLITIAGGIHATSVPESVTKDFDYVIVGEGEETIVELLDALDNQKRLEQINGLAYLDNGEYRIRRRERLGDIDKNGSPIREFDIQKNMTA